jgi:hypothetical protein
MTRSGTPLGNPPYQAPDRQPPSVSVAEPVLQVRSKVPSSLCRITNR